MSFKWMGAVLIVVSCGGTGFAMAAASRREEQELKQLISALEWMGCELRYHRTQLPQLCAMASQRAAGRVKAVLRSLSELLSCGGLPDVKSCMEASLGGMEPDRLRQRLTKLGACLGQFDLEGQLLGLDALKNECCLELERLSVNRENRLRGYQTLGLCAGAALAILFV